VAAPQHPLELILARNLVTNLAIPSMVLDEEGALVFYNESAAEILGGRFEETGRLSADEWRSRLSPDDSDEGNAAEPLSDLLERGRPAHGRFFIRARGSQAVEVEAAGIPLEGPAGFCGALVAFWLPEE